VTTVLGSCVAICLWDSRRGCCAVNHFLLPVCSNGRPCLRYGDYSTDKLLEEMLCRGASPTTLEAKVFGGAAVLAVGPSGRNIGAQNVEFAFERLKALGIPVIASRTGGQCGVVIRVFTASRVVLVRPLVSVSVA
jgi:chemotaxis protein CheD